MRRQVLESQKGELEQARLELQELKKVHDQVNQETTKKERKLAELEVQLSELRRLGDPVNFRLTNAEAGLGLRGGAMEGLTGNGDVENQTRIDEIEGEVNKNQQIVRDLMVEKQKLQLMLRRLTREILELKKHTRQLGEEMRTVDNDVASSTLHFQHAKQELKNEDRKLMGLRRRVESQRAQQEVRMSGVHQLVDQRQALLAMQEERLQMKSSAIAQDNELETLVDRLEDPSGRIPSPSMEGVGSPKRLALGVALAVRAGTSQSNRPSRGASRNATSSKNNALASTTMAHVASGRFSSKRLAQDQQRLAMLEQTLQQLKFITGLDDVPGIIEKFNNRTTRLEELSQMTEDIQKRSTALKQSNTSLQQQLADVTAAVESSEGHNREVYQEADLVDEKLAQARKRFQEVKDRAHKLDVSLDSLRESLARFVNKVDAHGKKRKPNESLSMLVNQLDGHISQVMKAVNADLMNTASPKSSRRGNDANTYDPSATGDKPVGLGGTKTDSSKDLHLSKLENTNVKRLLYQRLMAAEPDVTEQNVRTRPKPKHPAAARRMLGYFSDEDSEEEDSQINVQIQSADESEEDSDMLAEGAQQNADKEDETREPTMDRDLVKKVSMMIINRDHSKKKKVPKRHARA